MCEVCKDGEVLFELDMNCIEDVLEYVEEQLGLEDLCFERLDNNHYMLYSNTSDIEIHVYYKN